MDDDHDIVTDIDSDTLIRIVKFLKRGKAPGPNNIRNGVLRPDTTASLLHHLSRTAFYFLHTNRLHPNYMELATLRMLLKPEKFHSLTTSYTPISLMS